MERRALIILMIDHDPMSRALTARMLKAQGYTVIAASAATDALETFFAHHMDIGLVLADPRLPDMTGPQLFDALGAIDPGVPVIVRTPTDAFPSTFEHCENVAGGVSTACGPDELLAGVQRALHGPGALLPLRAPRPGSLPPPASRVAELPSRPRSIGGGDDVAARWWASRRAPRAEDGFEWPPRAEDLAAIEVVDARTLQRIELDTPAPAPFELLPPVRVTRATPPFANIELIHVARPQPAESDAADLPIVSVAVATPPPIAANAALMESTLAGLTLAEPVSADPLLAELALVKPRLTEAVLAKAAQTRAALSNAALAKALLVPAGLARAAWKAALTKVALAAGAFADAALSSAARTSAALARTLPTRTDLSRIAHIHAEHAKAVLTKAALASTAFVNTVRTKAVVTRSALGNATPTKAALTHAAQIHVKYAKIVLAKAAHANAALASTVRTTAVATRSALGHVMPTKAALTRIAQAHANHVRTVLMNAALANTAFVNTVRTRAVVTRSALGHVMPTKAALMRIAQTHATHARTVLTKAALANTAFVNTVRTRAVVTRSALGHVMPTKAALRRIAQAHATHARTVLTKAALANAALANTVRAKAALMRAAVGSATPTQAALTRAAQTYVNRVKALMAKAVHANTTLATTMWAQAARANAALASTVRAMAGLGSALANARAQAVRARLAEPIAATLRASSRRVRRLGQARHAVPHLRLVSAPVVRSISTHRWDAVAAAALSGIVVNATVDPREPPPPPAAMATAIASVSHDEQAGPASVGRLFGTPPLIRADRIRSRAIAAMVRPSQDAPSPDAPSQDALSADVTEPRAATSQRMETTSGARSARSDVVKTPAFLRARAMPENLTASPRTLRREDDDERDGPGGARDVKALTRPPTATSTAARSATSQPPATASPSTGSTSSTSSTSTTSPMPTSPPVPVTPASLGRSRSAGASGPSGAGIGASTAAADAAPTPLSPSSLARPRSRTSEERQIYAALERYERAYERLDAKAVHAVWPSLDTRALAREFGGLKGQDLEFSRCDLALQTREATAVCGGRATYVPRVGNQARRTESREWTFRFQKIDEDWLIVKAEAR